MEPNRASRKSAAVTAISYHLPEQVLTNEDIARKHPEWSVEKIYQKTGIRSRHIAASHETALDLGLCAGKKLLASGVCSAEQIDLLLFCTQTPDYALPTSACILQDRLGLPTHCAAFDFNLGCSGFVYGLSIAKSMLEANQATKAILITAETYSKWIDENDKSVLTVFGDGATATLVELLESPDGQEYIGPFVYGTDGSGYKRLIVHGSGARRLDEEARRSVPEGHRPDSLYMDGAEIFAFSLRTVPQAVQKLLDMSNRTLDHFDLICFHQANTYMLENLRRRSKIPKEKFVLDLEDCGNTVSCTIPIALKDQQDAGVLKPGMSIAIVGFGVGYSWAAASMIWKGKTA